MLSIISDSIWIALISIIPATVLSLPGILAVIQSRKTHQLVNSRMSELLELTRKASRAEGVKEGEGKPYRKRPRDSGDV